MISRSKKSKNRPPVGKPNNVFSMSPQLGIYTRYNELGASSRLRYYLFRRAFEKAHFEVAFHPFFSSEYLRKLYATGRRPRLSAATALLRRLTLLPRLEENLLIEYELLPELPATWELRMLRNHRYVLNFDDNVWEKYAARPHLAGKDDELVRHAAGVSVDNDFLADRSASLNTNRIKIPTVVDLDRYHATENGKFERFTVAWIGTPVTYAYLEAHAAHLAAMAAAVDFELLVIARRELSRRRLPGVRMRFADWSIETETELLARSHVGIMPLSDDPFSRGKSAFKLIQYLAAGIPAIASRIGENRQVLRDGETGFFADTPREWADALLRLAGDSRLREEMAKQSRRVAFDYSLQKYGPIEAEFLSASFR